MALRKSLVLAVSAASILFSAAAFAQTDATTTPDAPAKKTTQHAPKKKATHAKKTHTKKTTNTTSTTTAQ